MRLPEISELSSKHGVRRFANELAYEVEVAIEHRSAMPVRSVFLRQHMSELVHQVRRLAILMPDMNALIFWYEPGEPVILAGRTVVLEVQTHLVELISGCDFSKSATNAASDSGCSWMDPEAQNSWK